MIEIELFYKIVEAKIRAEHTEYLEGEKRAAVEIPLPSVPGKPPVDEWRKMGLMARVAFSFNRRKQLKERKKAERKKKPLRVEDKLLKGYNKGIKKALRILESEYVAFSKRILSEEFRGKKL